MNLVRVDIYGYQERQGQRKSLKSKRSPKKFKSFPMESFTKLILPKFSIEKLCNLPRASGI